MIRTGDRSPQVADALNPLCRPPWKADAQFRPACSSRIWSMREAVPQQDFAPPSRSVFTHLECANFLWERTMSRWYAARYAPSVRTRQRAKLTARPLSKAMVARRWFPLWFPRYCSGFHWQSGNSKVNSLNPRNKQHTTLAKHAMHFHRKLAFCPSAKQTTFTNPFHRYKLCGFCQR